MLQDRADKERKLGVGGFGRTVLGERVRAGGFQLLAYCTGGFTYLGGPDEELEWRRESWKS